MGLSCFLACLFVCLFVCFIPGVRIGQLPNAISREIVDQSILRGEGKTQIRETLIFKNLYSEGKAVEIMGNKSRHGHVLKSIRYSQTHRYTNSLSETTYRDDFLDMWNVAQM